MRQKGKPKAKTKLAAASNNCDSDQQEAGNGNKQMVTPLIAISHAPAGPSNPSTGRVAINQPEVETPSTRQNKRETVVLFDGQSQTVLESRGEQVKRLQRHETNAGIGLVSESYIKLMARNSLYQFYLGSFAFSVMNMIFLLTFNCCTQQRAPGDDLTNLVQLNGTLTSSNNLTTANCDNNPAKWAPSLQDLRHLVWLLLISLLLVTAVQLVVLVFECYAELQCRRRVQQPQQRPLADFRQDTNTSNQSHQDKLSDLGQRVAARLLMPMAVSSSYSLLILPTLMFHLNQSSWMCPGKRPSLPLTTIAITSYLLTSISSLPTFIYSSSRLLRCSHFLLLLVLWLVIEQKHDDQFHLIYFVWFIALMLGAMRYKVFIGTHHEETFKQANQLIEAKVSLEQQRQQQETLLLSVLPAYVAEQVKRNMLKKMDTVKEPLAGVESLDGQCDSLQASQLSCNASGPIGHPPAAPLHSMRSLTLPANCDGPPLASRDQQQQVASVTSIPKRRSVAARLKLGSSFAIPSNRFAVTASLTTSEQSHNQQTTDQQPPVVGLANSNQLNPTPQVVVGHQSHQSRRGFNELYIRTYNNVSLLYGDIVGFTRLCSQLSSSQLVLVLNKLFSYFDYLAEQHKIMRIKILGDCYYGVSGIPEFAVLGAKSSSSSRHQFNSRNGQQHKSIGANSALCGKSGDNHAINCVNMGLDMIHYIKCLNIERTSQLGQDELIGGQTELPANFELNMRIGIHTGHIHSGVIGLKKWQFDVWSNDVCIAMHCESSGVAGRVQVTEATVQHLRNAFTFEPATRSSRDTFLADRSIRTFLIVDRVQLPGRPLNNHLFGKADQQTLSGGIKKDEISDNNNQKQSKRTQAYSFAPSEIQAMDQGRIREATIGTIRQTLLAGELAGSGGGGGSSSGFTSGAPLASSGLARLDYNDMRWWTLEFKDPPLNGQFNARLIPASHHLGQLSLLFLLLIVLMPILNYKLVDWNDFDDQEDGTHSLMLASFLLALPLIVVALLPKSRSVTKNMLRRRRSTLTDSASIGRASNRSSPIHWIRATDSTTLGDENELVSRRHNKWVRLNKLCSKLKPSKWHFNKRQANNLPGLYLVALTLILFTVFQYNLLRRATCNQLNQLQQKPTETNSNNHRLKQLHQLTMFSLLAALDLSSSLLPFRLRAAFLVVIAMIQLLILCATANAMRRRQSSLFQQMLTARNLMGALCGGSQFTNVEPNEAFAGIRTSDIGQHLLDWSGDALLLILSLWSWAFQRQLEYSHRANFLWRNRLNVDHEELEYISGINKVLLENILPSHVVQHYLDQPTTKHNEPPLPTTTTFRENTSEAATVEQQQRDRKASRVLVASGNQLMGVAMSPTQLRSLPEFHPLDSGRETSRLAANKQTVGHELYHEQHESVAVMFASIPHFYEFYDESDISKQGLGCIALLNEIICDFDKLLLKNKFSRIEKIKTIGSTYMAAAGLRPSCPARNSNASQISQPNAAQTPNRDCDWQQQQVVGSPNCLSATDQHQQASGCATPDRRLVLSQQKMNLICMIQFATSLMSALNGINKQSFQLFKLRVGVNTGPVVAGIIGAQRPFYDIWGDCVNIASRMESLGEVGRIQVEERTAKLLSECLCPETYAIERRGPIDVKGKGGMVTYFVDKRQQSQSAQPPQPSQQPQQQQQRHELAG